MSSISNWAPLPRHHSRALGVLLTLSGLILNKWSIERTLAPDEHLENPWYVATIVVFQLALVASGLWLVLVGKAPKFLARLRNPAIGILLAAIGIGVYGNLKAAGIVDPNREFRASWERMVASEELIVILEKKMKKLTASAMNLELPDHLSESYFQQEVTVRDLADASPERVETLGTGIEIWQFPVEAESRRVPLVEFSLWSGLLENVEYFQNAKFYTIRGRFLDEARASYQSDVGFKALARTSSNRWQWIQASLELGWSREEGGAGEEPVWRIGSIETKNLSTMDTDELLFTEVLEEVLDPVDLARARRSRHEELVRDLLLKKESFEKPNPWFYIAAVDRHPGVSVVDLDRDGLDDLYLMERETKNMLFRNRGDGTFEEIASEVGLDVEDFTSSAIFADFDNDGDTDAVLGRTLSPSLYLENVEGRFVARSDAGGEPGLPFLVSSVNAVDYDNDGLLDVYFSTYAAQMINASEDDLDKALTPYLVKNDIRQIEHLLDDDRMGNKRMNFPGPPNVLFKNLGGGRFGAVDSSVIRVFRNTYQSTWADFDGDGDADVYLANDFAPNNMIRNEGNGTFVDVTEETQTADIGFGMGAAWGDYDNDGKQDLYVSNMFSKAGQRITSQLDSIDPRFGQMAKGNSLFRNTDGRFEKVSGVEPGTLLVESAGWSWGSQFLDADNDGFQDIFAVSGHYSAPKEVDADVDI